MTENQSASNNSTFVIAFLFSHLKLILSIAFWTKKLKLSNNATILTSNLILRTHMHHFLVKELRELSALVQRESTQEAVAVFRTEIMQVLREIQLEYEQRLEAAKADIHSAYEVRARVLRQTGVARTGVEGELAPVHLRQLLVDQRRKISTLEEAVSISASFLRNRTNHFLAYC